MKRIFSCLVLLFAIVYSNAQSTDTIRVLFVGNSFTSNNNLPLVFQQLAAGAGRPVVVVAHVPGGVSVGDTAQGTQAHMNNPQVFSLIRSDNWNYLVLQDNQGRFVNNYGVFPGSSKVIEGHIKIRDSLLYYHPCARMLWFAGWGPKAGYLPYASTGTGLIDKIYNNYRYLLDTAGQVIAPIGPAWQRIIANDTTINLWDADDTHPGINGTSLTADVIYATVFKSSPIHSSYVLSGISPAVDSVLKNTGYQTVLDSVGVTGLQTISPVISQNGNTLTVNGYVNCSWYLNGSFLTTNSGTLTMTQPGTYAVVVSDVTHCEFRTFEYTVSVLNAIEDIESRSAQIVVFPNPSDGKFSIESTQELEKIEIVNYLGQTIRVIQKPKQKEMLEIENTVKGIYFIIATDKKGVISRQELVIQ